MATNQKLRTDPRISINKLAEYIAATGPLRRQSIVRDQIAPPDFKVIRYREARSILARFVMNPVRRPADLLHEAAKLRDAAGALPLDNMERSRMLESAQAIEAFAPVARQVRRKGLLAVPGQRRESLTLSGVRVTISPDVCFIDGQTERRVGAAKFNILKTRPLDTEGLRIVATLLHEHVVRTEGDARKAACIAVDVMTRSIEPTPRGTVLRMRNIEAACKEIATTWPVLLAGFREGTYKTAQ